MGCFKSTKKFSTVSTKANLWMVCLLGGLSKVWGFGFRGLGFLGWVFWLDGPG